jgi:hypothetical protein
MSVPSAEPEAGPEAGPGKLAELLGGWVAGLDERRRAAFCCHIDWGTSALSHAAGLRAVIPDHVRRQQRTLAADLSAWQRRCAAAATGMSGLRARLHAVCPVVALWEEAALAIPELAEPVPGSSACLADLVRLLLPELHRDGPWVAWRPVGDLRDLTIRMATGRACTARRSALLEANRQALGLEDRAWDAWLGYCGLGRFRGLVVRSEATIAELAEAVLAERGQPMSVAEIAGQIRVAPWKVRDSCLGRDERFCRTQPGVFGLAEWELPAYPGIRGFIIEQIAAAGGQARLADIAAAAASRFGMRERSVYGTARSPDFTRADGMISLAEHRLDGQAEAPCPAGPAERATRRVDHRSG